MEKEQLHKKLDDFLAGSNKEKVDKELFSLLVRMDECRKVASPPDKERMWKQVCRTLKYSRRRELVRKWAVAAAIVMPLAVGIWFYGHHSDEVVPKPENVGKRHQVSLTLNDGRVLQVQQWNNDSVIQESGTGILVSAGQQMIYHAENVQLEEEIFNTLSVPRSTEYQVQLSDGTRVWLNSESELRYPVDFVGTERKVFLKGEAYFSVSKQAGKPFVVCVGDSRITVLGTEFNVRNYQDEVVATTLVKGAVRIHDAGRECDLTPGQQAVIEADGIRVREVDTDLYTAWKDGYFIYREKTLDDIMKELSRWYDFTYDCRSEESRRMTLTAKLRKFDRVEDIFDILKRTGRLDFAIQGKNVTVVAK